MAKTNYLSNKQLLKEIHRSKRSYCEFTAPHYHQYDVIVEELDEIFEHIHYLIDNDKIDNVKIKFRISNRRRIRRFIWLDTFVLFLVSLKKIIGFNKRLGILTKVRGFNTKTINSEYDKKLDIDILPDWFKEQLNDRK